MWVMGAGPPGQRLRVHHYQASRSGDVPVARLEGFEDAPMADGYAGYCTACRAHGTTRLWCWAHAPRKFFDAAKLQPKAKTGRSDQALALIGKPYRIERDTQAPATDERHRLRQGNSQAVIDQLHTGLIKT
jgi:transposase